jgi:hypothetical protein
MIRVGETTWFTATERGVAVDVNFLLRKKNADHEMAKTMRVIKLIRMSYNRDANRRVLFNRG